MAESGGQERLIAEIRQLKQKQRAVILAHNYQLPEIYEVADFIGDSLELAQAAARVESALIVFCGVRFMAENAKLVNPGRPVVLANPRAGCPMADMITAEALRRRRQELGDVLVVAYVNTPAEVKAEADICCTSANAVRVVQSLPGSKKILFVPDRNLGRWVEHETGREIIPWEGFCYVHAQFTVEDVRRARIEHPGALVVAHPECPLEVIQVADRVASTSGMVRIAREVKELVLGTEAGMCNRIRREYPDRHCYPLRRTAICRNMKLTSLEDVKAALQGMVPEVEIPVSVAERAQLALKRMLEIS
ncbi:MAG: quinolinate synthase NadA [candidate division WOR-3 bacterium]